MRLNVGGETMSGMTVIATLVVKRTSQAWIDRARAYQILVDGVVKGTVRCGRELSLALPPGAHVVQARLDWTGSEPLRVHLGPGSTVRVKVEPRGVVHAAGRRYLRLSRMAEPSPGKARTPEPPPAESESP